MKEGQRHVWRAKPKLHLVQELGEYMTEEVGNPRDFWNYADESFVGSGRGGWRGGRERREKKQKQDWRYGVEERFIAQLALSRGGARAAGTTPHAVIERYRALARK